MKRTEWEKQLLKNLKALPKTERERIAEYYREMYNDKLDAGFSPEEILREFGDPAQCAEKILAEETPQDASRETPQKRGGFRERFSSELSVGRVICNCLFALCVVLPLAVTAVSLVIATAALCVSFAAAALGCVVYALAAFFQLAGGMEFAGVLVHAGVGFIGAGICAALFVGAFLLTKALVKWLYKIGRYYLRRAKQ